MKNFEIYVADVESTGLDKNLHDIIEVSISRLSNDAQKTWFIKPLNIDTINKESLHVNGYLYEDVIGDTEHGRKTFLPATEVLPDIEAWLMEDNLTSSDRILAGQNIMGFDKGMLEAFWKKCNAFETYPFNIKYLLDTFQIEFFLDYVMNIDSEGYSLHNLCKKYGVKNEKSHTAAADVKATKEILIKQVENLRNKLGIQI